MDRKKYFCKKFVSVLLVVVMVVSSVPLSMGSNMGERTVYAQTSEDGRWEYTVLEDGTLEISGYLGSEAELRIPAKIDGLEVTSIGECAFNECLDLIDVNIPNGVTRIERCAFRWCGIRNITIPASVTRIGEFAFNECSNLSDIYIPESVISIEDGVFNGCINLEKIEVSSENNIYISENGVLYNKAKTKLISYPGGKKGNVVVTNGVTSIGDYAFSRCIHINSIYIGESVTNIGESAFWQCGMSDIYIPESVMNIGEGAFSECSNLRSISLPDEITSIGKWVFQNCTNLSSIGLPEGLMEIGYKAFSGCSKLNSINIPKGVTNIGESAFDGCSSLSNISLPEGVTCIERYTFRECSSLNNINIPEGVTGIGESAFSGCSSLSSINLPERITCIETFTFADCSSLNSINIPDEVTSIGSFAFSECSNLTNISLSENITFIGGGAFSGCSSLSDINLPEGITFIGASVFRNCSSLISISLPKSVTYISVNAFSDCSSLSSIRIYEGVTDISMYAFSRCNCLTILSPLNSYAHTYAIKYNIKWKDINLITNTDIAFVQDNTISFNIFDRDIFENGEAIQIDGNNGGITDVSTDCGNTTSSTSGNTIIFTRVKDYLEDYMIFKKDGYQDFMIPNQIASRWLKNEKKNVDIYMKKDKKDGKPYVSTVFGKTNDQEDYVELQNSNLAIVKDKKYDIYITASDPKNASIYYLTQDASHKIMSGTGVFKSEDLYSVFQCNKDIYAYIKQSDGTMSELVKVNLKKVDEENPAYDFFNASTINMIGSSGQKLTIPEDIPLIGGSSISVDGAKVPIGVLIEGDRVKVSFGMDIFNMNFEEGEKFEWGSFKKQCKTLNSSMKSAEKKKETFDKFMNSYYGFLGNSYNSLNNSFGMNFFGYIEAQITEDGLVFTDVCGTLAAEFAFKYTQQGVIMGVPTYFYVEGAVDTTVSISKARATGDKEVPLDFGIKLSTEPELKLGGGAGIKGAVSAGIYGTASLPYILDFSKQYRKMSLKGTLGLEGEFFVFKGKIPLLEGETVICEDYFGTGTSTNALVASSEDISVLSRSYMNTMSTFDAVALSLEAEENITVSELQTSVYSNGQCQVIAFDDKMMMVWVEDCSERDTYNRMRLMYAVYDGTTEQWSEAKPIYDDGTLDSTPSLATDGEHVYVVWQNINQTLTSADAEAVSELMTNSEIMVASYNAENDAFESVTRLTENSTYDYAPTVSVTDGTAVVYWANSASESFEAGQTSIWKQVVGEAGSAVYTGLNYVPALDCTNEAVSYIMDSDGNLATANDVYVYTNGVKVTDEATEGESNLNFTYGTINGVDTLFYTDNTNLYYVEDGIVKSIFEEGRSISDNLKVIANGNRTRVIWSELTEVGTEFYTCEYADGIWSQPVQLSDMGALLTNLDVTYYKNMIFGVFDRTARTMVTDDEGNTCYESGLTDMCQFTTAGFNDLEISIPYIDEATFVKGENAVITATVENLGTETISSVQFEISDTLGNTSNVIKELNLVSGEQAVVALDYLVPDNYAQTTLTVSAMIPDVYDAFISNNTVTKEIGYYDLQMGEFDIEKIGETYVVGGVVSNESLIDATDVTVNIMLGSEDGEISSSVKVEKIAAGEQYYIRYALGEYNVNQNYDAEYVCKVYIQAVGTGTEAMTENNLAVAAIAKEAVATTVSLENTSIVLSNDSYMYDGSEKEPQVTIEDGTNTLEEHVDYEVFYSDNINAGTATVTITGIGNYTGTVTKTFTIFASETEIATTLDMTTTEPEDSTTENEKVTTEPLETTTKSQESNSQETTEVEIYTTEEQKTQAPEETSKLEESTTEVQETQPTEEESTELEETTEQPPTKLPEESDSEEETTTEPEQVKQKLTSISLATSSYTYNGYAKKPVPTVKSETKKLVKNTDYKVTYKNNVNPGTATVIVTGTGNYTGTLTKTFKINLEKLSSLKQKTSYATSKIVMSWNKVKGANGYEVYRATSKNSTYKYLKTVTNNSYTQSGIQPGSKYYYKVRAYKTVNGKKIYGAYSERKSMITKPATPTITLTAGSKRIKVSWKKSSGANGYEVYMATSRNGSYTKIKSTNSLQLHYTKTGLSKGKKYYFKVRAFKKTGVGVKVYSGYSGIKTVSVK